MDGYSAELKIWQWSFQYTLNISGKVDITWEILVPSRIRSSDYEYVVACRRHYMETVSALLAISEGDLWISHTINVVQINELPVRWQFIDVTPESIKIYLLFIYFTLKMQEIETLPRRGCGPSCLIWSISWLLMVWRCEEPDQQQCYWSDLHIIFQWLVNSLIKEWINHSFDVFFLVSLNWTAELPMTWDMAPMSCYVQFCFRICCCFCIGWVDP